VQTRQVHSATEGNGGDAVVAVPAGTPEWITPELIRRTLQVWQPYYAERLTPEDAVTMIRSAGELFAVLSRE
jgi:hypothetical protein